MNIRDELITLGFELIVRPAGLQQRFVYPSTASDDTDGSTGTTGDCLFCARWETDAGLVIFGRVPNDGGIGTGCSSKRTTVADLLFNTTDDRSFGKLAHGEHISYVEGGLLATVDEGTSMETFGCDKGLLTEFITVWITEYDTSERSAAASWMNFNNSSLLDT